MDALDGALGIDFTESDLAGGNFPKYIDGMVVTLAKPEVVMVDAAIDQLAAMADNWDGQNAARIDRRILTAARSWLRNLSDAALTKLPAVVPLTTGTLQFEWHVDSRILEIEFEITDSIHYLKWDPAADVEDEGIVSALDRLQSERLIDWAIHG